MKRKSGREPYEKHVKRDKEEGSGLGIHRLKRISQIMLRQNFGLKKHHKIHLVRGRHSVLVTIISLIRLSFGAI